MKKKISFNYYSDVLIVGSGAAGLSLALRLSHKYKINILSKTKVYDGSTIHAQGGIATVFDKNDSISSHIEDTLISGAGLCNRKVVSFIINNARHCIEWLINNGVFFDTDLNGNKQRYHLTKEAGHSHRRILHRADNTGYEIETALINNALNNKNIEIFERNIAIDLIISNKINLQGQKQAVGMSVWNQDKKQIDHYYARAIVLATGGASKVYKNTTNPDISSGDGIAIAWRAGCNVANLEFNQFHPTSLFHSQGENFLLTEALRGEGAILVRPDGTRFMDNFDVRAELAPRDIVARAIDHEIKRLDVDCMYLDITHQPSSFIHKHFPTIYKKLLTFGFDLTKDIIPITPAAHYTCGGVVVNQQGRTNINRLYAIGEVSYTGLHGANRMASNSLLECLVYSWSTSEDLLNILPTSEIIDIPELTLNRYKKIDEDEKYIIQQNYHELRLVMWNYMGIVRTTKQLERALRRIKMLFFEINKYYIKYYISSKILELRNLTQVAELMVRCAIKRKESRGLHFIKDYPNLLPEAFPTILIPNSNINKY